MDLVARVDNFTLTEPSRLKGTETLQPWSQAWCVIRPSITKTYALPLSPTHILRITSRRKANGQPIRFRAELTGFDQSAVSPPLRLKPRKALKETSLANSQRFRCNHALQKKVNRERLCCVAFFASRQAGSGGFTPSARKLTGKGWLYSVFRLGSMRSGASTVGSLRLS